MLILTAAEFGNCFTLRPATVGSAEQRQINHPQPLLFKEGGDYQQGPRTIYSPSLKKGGGTLASHKVTSVSTPRP